MMLCDDSFIPNLGCEEVYHCSFDNVKLCGEDLNILFFNARSIVSKLDALADLIVLGKNIDLVIIVETWLREDISQFFNLPGYESIHVSRKEKKGGVYLCSTEKVCVLPNGQ